MPRPAADTEGVALSGTQGPEPGVAPPAKDHDQDFPDRLGRYEIKRRIGCGGFGVVYQAWDPVLERQVALKVPHHRAQSSEKAIARQLREPKAAGKLRHPNIVPLYDAGFDKDQLYIASALIEGETLAQAIKARRLDMRAAVEIVRKLADALQHAHALGIIHRDVKPSNVILDARGEPQLLDFGLARLEQADACQTGNSSIMGTPSYMSPEQACATDEPVGPATDQYSLGATLYELLSGEKPFDGPPAYVIYQLKSQPAKRLREINPVVPIALEEICRRAMAKLPSERYLGMAEFGAALSEFLKSPANAAALAASGAPAADSSSVVVDAELVEGESPFAPASGEAKTCAAERTFRDSPRVAREDSSICVGKVQAAHSTSRGRMKAFLAALLVVVVMGASFNAFLYFGRSDRPVVIGEVPPTPPVKIDDVPSPASDESEEDSPFNETAHDDTAGKDTSGHAANTSAPGTSPQPAPPPVVKVEPVVQKPQQPAVVAPPPAVVRPPVAASPPKEISTALGSKLLLVPQEGQQPPFYLGAHEVKQQEYTQVMQKNPSKFQRGGQGWTLVKDEDTSRLPVDNVTMFEALEFCNRLSQMEGLSPYYRITGQTKVEILGGHGYRLPMFAEWGLASRDLAQAELDAFAWHDANSDGRTHPIGTKRPNQLGFYDLVGNVAEWISPDPFEITPQATTAATPRPKKQKSYGGGGGSDNGGGGGGGGGFSPGASIPSWGGGGGGGNVWGWGGWWGGLPGAKRPGSGSSSSPVVTSPTSAGVAPSPKAPRVKFIAIGAGFSTDLGEKQLWLQLSSPSSLNGFRIARSR